MINTVIIQSPNRGRNVIGNMPEKCLPLMKIVGEGSSISDGIQLIKSAKPNLVILDVDFPDGSGFQVFEETSEVDYEKIILCDHSGYAIKAARYHVADYLLKPFRREEIVGAVERLLFSQKQYKVQQRFEDEVRKRGQLRLERVIVKGFGQSKLIAVNDIVRISEEGNHRRVHLCCGSVIDSPQRLSRIAYNLVWNRFFRIGNSILNLSHVQEYLAGGEQHYIYMVDGTTVEVPMHLEQKLKSQLNLPGLRGSTGFNR